MECCNGKTQLHILPDKIFIITNQGYYFEKLREWPIGFCRQVMVTQSCVKLITTNETLALRTQKGSEIKSVLTERLCWHSPVSPSFHHGPFPGMLWDRNSNRAQQLSCSSSLKSESMSSLANESLFSSQGNLLSPRHESYSSDENVNANITRQNACCILDPCCVTSSGKCSSLDDNLVNTQRLMELTVDNKPGDCNDEIKSNRTAQDYYQMTPPPIPRRRPKLPAKAETTVQNQNCASSAPLEKAKSKSDPGEFAISRSCSFQIVEQPLHNNCYRKRQRYRSDPSMMARKTITEYVQPICVSYSQTNENSGKVEQLLPSNDECLIENKQTSPADTKGKDCETTASETNNDDTSGNDKIHYVHLPVGSRPSCYLYMNLPGLGSAPKEQARNVEHVFISRNMKVIYENVLENDLLSVDERETLPPLPPPILQPRKPPPRLPERTSSDRRRLPQRPPVELPKTEPTPPPRPPKKQKVGDKASKTLKVPKAHFELVIMKKKKEKNVILPNSRVISSINHS